MHLLSIPLDDQTKELKVMISEVRGRFPLRVVGLTLALAISGVPAHAQTDTHPPQALPNMGQQIPPWAPSGSQFVTLNPGLKDNPDWLAGQIGRGHVWTPATLESRMR